MRTPDSLRRSLRLAWARNRCDWLAGGGIWPLALSMGSPSKYEVMESWDAFGSWLVQWQADGLGRYGRVRREARFRRAPFGEQLVPRTWEFDTPALVAAELGEQARWERAEERFARLMQWLGDGRPEDPSGKRANQWRRVVSRRFDLLADADDDVFESLLAVVEWIRKNPASGLFPRQLPIPGIDSKWVEKWKRLLTAWVWVLRGGAHSHNFYKVTGLRAAPDRLRMRLLDPALRSALGGLSDIEAPAVEFTALRLPVQRVLIVENLATGLACESSENLPGTLVFMRRGYAVDALARLPWMAPPLPVYYWGDIDTHGLAILSRMRAHLPQTKSLMMDEGTLLAFQSLWGKEEKQHAALELSHLTEKEQCLYRALRDGKYRQVRLEQERIAWGSAWKCVMDSLFPQEKG